VMSLQGQDNITHKLVTITPQIDGSARKPERRYEGTAGAADPDGHRPMAGDDTTASRFSG
jgi:hypothetical protein